MPIGLHRFLLCMLTAVLLFVWSGFPIVSFAEVPAASAPASDISKQCVIEKSEGFPQLTSLFDKQERFGARTLANARLTLTHEDGIGSVYLLFTERTNPLVITDHASGITHTTSEYLFLHEFVDLVSVFESAPTSITIEFGPDPVLLTEIFIFSTGEIPKSVQKWEPPAEKSADLLLLSAHGDDDQIFFAGIIPHYAVCKGLTVQVVYLTDHHNNEPYRVHEMLDGLWAAGLKTYPVFGHHPDFVFSDYSRLARVLRNKAYAYNTLDSLGYTRDQLLGFVVEQLRRFKPQVAVTHDFNGEYGHPHHLVCADLMAEAIAISQDESMYPELAQRYGVWDVPKTYIHLYEENTVCIDIDSPQECFNGMSAFEVSKNLALPCHKSQFKGVSYYVAPYQSSTDMPYSSSRYGLYRSMVGMDVAKNDFFENLLSYKQQAEKAEKERMAAEEAARLEAEKRAAEEAARLEAEKLAVEETARQVAEEAAQKQMFFRTCIIAGCTAGTLVIIGSIIVLNTKMKKSSE